MVIAVTLLDSQDMTLTEQNSLTHTHTHKHPQHREMLSTMEQKPLHTHFREEQVCCGNAG